MRCPVCSNTSTVPALSGTDFLYETTDRTFNLNSCNACCTLFLNPLPGADEIASFYPAQYWWSGSKPNLLRRLESIYRNLALYDHVRFITLASRKFARGPAIRLLDIGCGSGTLIGLLKQRGFDVLGVDTSEEASAVAARDYGVRVMVGTLGDAGIADQTFDMITLFHVMEHVTNPREVLGEVRRILKSDGVMVLQVPNIGSWQFRWFGARWYGLDIPRHVIDYSEQSMTRLLGDCGFGVKRIRHFNFRDNAPALVSSLAPFLDPVSRAVRQKRRNQKEPAFLAWTKHLAYLALVIGAYPLALLEAMLGHGATVMVEAHKR